VLGRRRRMSLPGALATTVHGQPVDQQVAAPKSSRWTVGRRQGQATPAQGVTAQKRGSCETPSGVGALSSVCAHARGGVDQQTAPAQGAPRRALARRLPLQADGAAGAYRETRRGTKVVSCLHQSPTRRASRNQTRDRATGGVAVPQRTCAWGGTGASVAQRPEPAGAVGHKDRPAKGHWLTVPPNRTAMNRPEAIRETSGGGHGRPAEPSQIGGAKE